MAMERMTTVLALNSGSSSLKFGVYQVDSHPSTTPVGAQLAGEPASRGLSDTASFASKLCSHRGGGSLGGQQVRVLLEGEAEGLGSDHAQFSANGVDPEPLHDATVKGALQRLEHHLNAARLPTLDAVGHRIVHGGPHLNQPCLIDDRVLAQLREASVFAPLHAPAALDAVDTARAHFAGVPQIACFDTGFHATLPELARRLPIPHELHDQGVRRYGFHGLSCASIVRQLGDDLPARLIVAHLGSGASVTAIRQGQSVDTSMGLTPSGGIVMGTRSGDLDPGVLIYLMRERGMDADALEQLIDHHSGLLGVSGVASDMRALHDAAGRNGQAQLAIDLFCQSVRKQIAAMVAVLEGVDVLVFTGGLGEHDAAVRERVLGGLQWLGLGAEQVRILPALEDQEIALAAARVLCKTEG